MNLLHLDTDSHSPHTHTSHSFISWNSTNNYVGYMFRKSLVMTIVIDQCQFTCLCSYICLFSSFLAIFNIIVVNTSEMSCLSMYVCLRIHLIRCTHLRQFFLPLIVRNIEIICVLSNWLVCLEFKNKRDDFRQNDGQSHLAQK